MGNECPECETPAKDCKMRDIFKDEPRNRDDLDLSHIKKGEYRMKSRKQAKLQQSAVKIHSIPMSESIVIEKTHKKVENAKIVDKKSVQKREELILIASAVQQVKKAFNFDSQIQTIQIKNGIKYVGGSVHRQPHERGKISWQDGTTMISKFYLGKLVQQQKVLLQTQTGISFQGNISAGKANGNGKLVLPDGSSYEGEWRDDQPHGQGKQKMSDGSYYQGNFMKGQKTGKGKYYFDQGMYQGMFLNDKFHGEGITILNDGRTIKGMWRNGLIEDKGEIQWKTGEKYIGNFVGGQRDGQGAYYFADGRQWTGEWRNDMQNGFGYYQLPNGVTVKGIWVNGVKTDQKRQNLIQTD